MQGKKPELHLESKAGQKWLCRQGDISQTGTRGPVKGGIISKYTRIAGIAATLPDKLRHMVTLLKGLRNLHVTQEAINKEPWKFFM